jgi:hypothetical protein
MFKVLSGRLMNHLTRSKAWGATPTGPVELETGSAVSPYAVANLYDSKVASPLVLAAAAFYRLGLSLNVLTNGDMEQGTTGWTASSASLDFDFTKFVQGSKSLTVTPSGANGHGYQDATVRKGESSKLFWSLQGSGTSAASIRVKNLFTGNWLRTDGSWGAEQALDSQTTAAWKTSSQVFAVEDDGARTSPSRSNLPEEMTVRVFLQGATSGQLHWFDEILLVPGWDLLGLFGHNLAPSAILDVGTNATYWHGGYGSLSSALYAGHPTDASARTVAGPVAFHTLGALRYDPWIALSITLATAAQTYLGELVVGQTTSLSSSPEYPVAIEHQEPNIRYRTSGGSVWAMPRGAYPTRKATLSFMYFTDAEYQQARERIYAASRGGAYPLVLVPTETDSDACIFGRIEDGTTFRRDSFSSRMAEFVVQEEAFPWL